MRQLNSKTKIIDVWNDFALTVLSRLEKEPALMNVMKRSFYAGAITMYSLMITATEDDVPDEDMAYRLKELLDELNRYFQDEKAR